MTLEENVERHDRRNLHYLQKGVFALARAAKARGQRVIKVSLLQGLSGARYDAVEKVLHLRPSIKGDFRCFLATASGYGTVGVKGGQPFLHVASGDIPYKKIEYIAA